MVCSRVPSRPSTPVPQAPIPDSVPATPEKQGGYFSAPGTPSQCGFELGGAGFPSSPTSTCADDFSVDGLRAKFSGRLSVVAIDHLDASEHVGGGATAQVYAFTNRDPESRLELIRGLDPTKRYVVKVTIAPCDAVYEADQWLHVFPDADANRLKGVLIIRSAVRSPARDVSVPAKAPPLVGLVFEAVAPAHFVLACGTEHNHHFGISVSDFLRLFSFHFNLTNKVILLILKSVAEFVSLVHGKNRAIMDLSKNNILLFGENLTRNLTTADAPGTWGVSVIDLGETTAVDDEDNTTSIRRVACEAPECKDDDSCTTTTRTAVATAPWEFKEIDGKAYDVFCLGQVLVELCSKQTSNLVGPTTRMRTDIDSGIIVLRNAMICPNPSERPDIKGVIAAIGILLRDYETRS